MRVKSIVTEDFSNYKEPSLFIVTSECDWKCCTELGLDIGVCQNAPLVSQPTKQISIFRLYDLYFENNITKAVVLGGLEPMLQINAVELLIDYFRFRGENCPFVIYTGYYPDEIKDHIQRLSKYNSIIVKFGRYIPDMPDIFDEVLGVTLASDNQYALQIS